MRVCECVCVCMNVFAISNEWPSIFPIFAVVNVDVVVVAAADIVIFLRTNRKLNLKR